MAFKHRISFATDLAANLGWNRFRIMPDIISKLLRAAIWSRCAVQFKSEQSPFPWTSRRLRSAALQWQVCTGFDLEHAVLFLCHIFTQSPINDCKIERSDGRCFDRQQLLAHSMEISFPMKKNSFVTARYLQSIKTFLTVKLSQHHKTPDLTPCVCTRLSNPPKLCRSAAPRAWPLILQSNPSIVFSNSLWEWLPGDQHWLAGAWTWTQTWTLPPDQWVVEVLSAQEPQNKIQ